MSGKKKFSFVSVILSVICVVFVCEAAAPAAAIGNQQFFWWIFLIITFLLPYGMVVAELGTTYDSEGGIYDWVRDALGDKWGARISWYYWINFPLWMASLAILFPETKFHLVDSIGKKVRVATEVANAIGLKNVTFRHARAEEEKQLFDFVVSRAVMPLADLIKIIKKNISPKQQNAMPNGLICLKGGELEHETMPFKHKTVIHSLSENFEEEFFETKKVVYSQI